MSRRSVFQAYPKPRPEPNHPPLTRAQTLLFVLVILGVVTAVVATDWTYWGPVIDNFLARLGL